MEGRNQPKPRQMIASVFVILISLGMMVSNFRTPLEYGLIGLLGALALLGTWLSFKRRTSGKHSSAINGMVLVGLGSAFCVYMVWQFGFPKSIGEADFLVGGAIMLLAGTFMIVRGLRKHPEDVAAEQHGAPDDTSGE